MNRTTVKDAVTLYAKSKHGKHLVGKLISEVPIVDVIAALDDAASDSGTQADLDRFRAESKELTEHLNAITMFTMGWKDSQRIALNEVTPIAELHVSPFAAAKLEYCPLCQVASYGCAHRK